MRRFLPSLILLGVALAQPKIEVKDAWVREVPPNSRSSAAYMVIENQGNEPDKLIGAKSDISKVAEIHETVGGKMRRVKYIEIPAGKKVELKPGGYHIMLIDLKKPTKEGQQVELVLQFEKSGQVKVNAPVKKGIGKMEEHHHH